MAIVYKRACTRTLCETHYKVLRRRVPTAICCASVCRAIAAVQVSECSARVLRVRRLASYLPSEYVKTRGVERTLAEEHRKWFELPAADLKLKYVRKCRSLPTYGITFFLVKARRRTPRIYEPPRTEQYNIRVQYSVLHFHNSCFVRVSCIYIYEYTRILKSPL